MENKDFLKEYDTIVKAYDDKLVECHYKAFDNFEMPVEYIANYLKYLRDYYLITTPDDDKSQETIEKVSALIAATSAYDEYINIKQKLTDKNLTEEIKKDLELKQNKNWQLFIQFLAVNIGDGN